MNLTSVRRLSVRTSVPVNMFVSALLLDYRSGYFDDTSHLCRTGHDDVSRTEMRALTFVFFIVISPLMLFMHIGVCSVT